MGVHHLQEITALLAFGPKPVLASRKEGNTPIMLRLLPRFFIHVTQHHHLEGLCILYDSRNQATTLFEVYLFVHLSFLLPHGNVLLPQFIFQRRNQYLTVMKYGSCQRRIHVCLVEHIHKGLRIASTAGGNERDGYMVVDYL